MIYPHAPKVHRPSSVRPLAWIGLCALCATLWGCEAIEEDEGLTLSVPDAASFAVSPPVSPTRDAQTLDDALIEDTSAESSQDSTMGDAEGPIEAFDSTPEPIDTLDPLTPDSEEPIPEVICGDAQCDGGETCTTCPVDCPVCSPSVGDVVITEIMRDPSAVADSEGEWVELHNVSDQPLDLSGLRLLDDGNDSYVLSPTAPMLIAPGAYVVVGASVALGGAGQATEVWDGFYVGNGIDAVILQADEVVIDAVFVNGDAAWPATKGASMSLDPAATDANTNDDPSAWCSASIPTANGDLGTPGAPNWPCDAPPPSVCGDGLCDGEESCEACPVDCGACPCADGFIGGCDGQCVSTSLLDDGVCDEALNCPLHLFDAGDCLSEGCGTHLIISEYIEGAGNTKAVELYNPTAMTADLSRYTLWKMANGGQWPDDATAKPLEGTLEPGDTFVFCHSKLAESFDSICQMESGGNPMNFNGNDALFLTFDGALVDQVGEAGEAPTAGWEVSGVSQATKDHTLRRAPFVTMGSSDWQSASNLEWIVEAMDEVSDLGSHTVAVPCVP